MVDAVHGYVAHGGTFGDGGKVEQPGATDVGVDGDREKRIMERLKRMERPDDQANE